jgi:hypothetical protein
MITLRATNAEYRGTKKASIGRVTGRDPKWGLALEWVGQRSGGTDVEHITDEPGLYQLRSYDRKGRQSEELTLVIPGPDGELREYGCPREEAMKVARELDAGRPLAEIVRATAASPLNRARAARAEHAAKLAVSRDKPMDERIAVQVPGLAVGGDCRVARAELVAFREAEIARLDAEIERLTAAGEPDTAEEWKIVTAKQAETAKAAAGVEEAIAACRAALAGLTAKQQKEVLAQMKKMFAPANPAATQPEQV